MQLDVDAVSINCFHGTFQRAHASAVLARRLLYKVE